MGAESWRSESKVLHNEAGRVKQQGTVAGETAQGSRKTRPVTEDTRTWRQTASHMVMARGSHLVVLHQGHVWHLSIFNFRKCLKRLNDLINDDCLKVTTAVVKHHD